MKKIKTFSFIFIVLGFCFSDANHLIFNRITLNPTNAEFVSIYNSPDNQEIDLSNYYITDNPSSISYYNLPQDVSDGSIDSWSVNPFHFIARFPDNTMIAPGEELVLSFHTNELFNSYYGYDPDLSLFEDMLDLNDNGTISCDADACSEQSILEDDAEALILFYWDEELSAVTVEDVDYFLWGSNSNAIDKTNIGEYLDDTPVGDQEYQSIHEDGYTFIRTDFSEGSEMNTLGNGITGHDETSENLNSTWLILETPEFGCTDSEAENYDVNATIDDGSCDYPEPGTDGSIDDIIHNCGDDAGESLSCNGEYDLSYESASQCPLYEQSVTTTGIVVDYFDITPFNGPYSFTIQDAETEGTIDFVVWPTSSSYQDGFDITQTDLNVLTQPPFGRYEVQITGDLGAYCDDDELLDINNEWQVTVEYESHIDIIQIYSMEGTVEEDSSIDYVEIKPEPYILIPALGETLDFSYTFPNNSQIRIRIFDISGRFITSLVTEHRVNAGTVSMSTGATAWDGRDDLGQIVPSGTYLIHIEAYDFSNGKTLRDIAPIVVGVNQ